MNWSRILAKLVGALDGAATAVFGAGLLLALSALVWFVALQILLYLAAAGLPPLAAALGFAIILIGLVGAVVGWRDAGGGE